MSTTTATPKLTVEFAEAYLIERHNDASSLFSEYVNKLEHIGGGVFCADLGYCTITKLNANGTHRYLVVKRYNNNERITFSEITEVLQHLLRTYW